jgi:hypothetical protein
VLSGSAPPKPKRFPILLTVIIIIIIITNTTLFPKNPDFNPDFRLQPA